MSLLPPPQKSPLIEGISRKTFDGVDDPGGTDGAWPTTPLFGAASSTFPIAAAFKEPGATEPSRAASPTGERQEAHYTYREDDDSRVLHLPRLSFHDIQHTKQSPIFQDPHHPICVGSSRSYASLRGSFLTLTTTTVGEISPANASVTPIVLGL